MPLTNHCTSYELSVALRDAGYPQEGALFYWWQDDFQNWVLLYREKLPDEPESAIEPQRFVAGPLVSELMEKIPKAIPHEWNGADRALLQIHFNGVDFQCGYNLSDGFLEPVVGDKTLLNCLAKLYLHLKQQSLI